MKRLSKTLCMICLSGMLSLTALYAVPSFTIDAKADEATADEQQLAALKAYLKAIKAAGASKEEIAFAKACITEVENRIIAQKAAQAQAEINAQAQAAAATMSAEQALAARKALEDAVNAQVKEMSKTVQQPAVVAPVIFVGDSRTVQTHELMGETGVTWIAENSKGYNWFVENAIPRIDSCAGKGSKIVINLGVNDLGNIDRYITLVNQKAIEWRAKGAKVYYETVNPVSENPYASEDKVVYFNNKIKNGLIGVNIINTHDYLMSTGYRLRDGLHYDGPTSLAIYNYVMGSLK